MSITARRPTGARASHVPRRAVLQRDEGGVGREWPPAAIGVHGRGVCRPGRGPVNRRQAGRRTSPSSPASSDGALQRGAVAGHVRRHRHRPHTRQRHVDSRSRQVEEHPDALVAMRPVVRDDARRPAVGRRDRRPCPAVERGRRASQREEPAVEVEHRRRSACCASTPRDPASSTIGSQGSAARTRVRRVAVHGIGDRSGSRPATSTTRSGGTVDVRQAQLVAVVQRRRAAQREQQHRRHARLAGPERGSRPAAGRGCRAPSSASAPGRQRRLVRVDAARRSCAASQAQRHEREVERQVDAVDRSAP